MVGSFGLEHHFNSLFLAEVVLWHKLNLDARLLCETLGIATNLVWQQLDELRVIEDADLLLVLVDGSGPLTEEDWDLIQRQPEKRRLVVVNKCDLPQRADCSELSAGEGLEGPCTVVRISAKTGAGLDDLRDQIRSSVLRPDYEPREGALVTRLRHLSAVKRAREALVHGSESVERNLSGEFLAMDLRAAIDALGEITGEITTDDILDLVFREFCIGK